MFLLLITLPVVASKDKSAELDTVNFIISVIFYIVNNSLCLLYLEASVGMEGIMKLFLFLKSLQTSLFKGGLVATLH